MALIVPLMVSSWVPHGSNFPTWRLSMAGGAELSAWEFSNTVSQTIRTPKFQMPTFTGALSLKLLIASSLTTGNVLFRCAVEAVASLDPLNTNTTNSFDTTNSGSSESIPATTYSPREISITLTNNDSVTAGKWVTLRLDRDTTVGSNVAAGVFVYGTSLWDAS